MGKKSYGYGYYAVKRGRNIGVYRDWNSCEEQVKGYRFAEHQRFDTEEDAWNFVREGNDQALDAIQNSTPPRIGYGNTLSIQLTNPRVNRAIPASNLQNYTGKYYAVKVGRKPGIYLTWDECKEQVNGFREARHKSCKTLEEAEYFVHFGSFKPLTNPIVEDPPEHYSNLRKSEGGGSKLTKLTLALGPTVSCAQVPMFSKRSEAVGVEKPSVADLVTNPTSFVMKGEKSQQDSGNDSFWDKFQTKLMALNRKRMSDEAFRSSSMEKWDEYERLSGSEDDEPVKTHLKATREEDEDEDEVVFVKQTKKRKGH